MSDRSVTRVRHELRQRQLDVTGVERITPHLIRVTLGGGQLKGFVSPGFDDHVKVFIPSGSEVPGRPAAPGSGQPELAAASPAPMMRDYTPHHFNAEALTLQLDFRLHDGAGPATAWALQAREGDKLTIGGPRGSFVVGTGFDWHLLMGDDTALPAIRRRLAELPAGSHVVVLAEVDGAGDEEPFESRAHAEVHWVYRAHSGRQAVSSLMGALAAAHLPSGACYSWIACESSDAKALRAALLERGADRTALKASGYWRRGSVAAHDVHE